MSTKKKQVIAMWVKQGKSGQPFFSGMVSEDVTLKKGQRLVMFSNGFKENERQPDWHVYEDDSTWSSKPSITPQPFQTESDKKAEDLPF